jgi:FkbM family methyltransferase
MREVLQIARFVSAHPLTRNRQLAAWYRVAKWQAVSRMNEEVIVSWIGGQRLAVRRGMHGITGNIYAGVHEFPDMMLTLHVLRAGDLFLDIGANVGSYTILASGVSGATSWAFEPDPVTLRHLTRNVELNNLEGRVRIFDCALGDRDGEVFFTVGLDTTNKVLKDGTSGNSRRVQQRRLDDLTADAAPFMIKMDTEGHEDHVFAGAEATLSANDLRVVVAETVSRNSEATLRRNGFERGYYEPTTRELSHSSSGQSDRNSLWIRDWDFVQARLREAPRVEIIGHQI